MRLIHQTVFLCLASRYRRTCAGLLLVVGLAAAGCIEAYKPEVPDTAKNYLVIDGFINPKGVTVINLSRTFDLGANAKTIPPAEGGASVYIEEEAGRRYPLTENTAIGRYVSAGSLVLNPAKRHRLRVLTRAGKDYASAYVLPKLTPPIDLVTWRTSATGLTISVDTHDPANAARYYRWDYEETWEFRPDLKPDLEYFNRDVRPIRVRYPESCWLEQKSTAIHQTNTVKLSQDVVTDYELHSIALGGNRLTYLYSFLVKQYAQDKEEYEYWEMLKKNTENIGTLFDPLPSQLTGNVQCLNDDSQSALGYVGVHSVQEKRIFIRRTELPRTWTYPTGYESCTFREDIIGRSDFPVLLAGGYYVPVKAVSTTPEGLVTACTYSTPECVDCRWRGSAVRPSFWP